MFLLYLTIHFDHLAKQKLQNQLLARTEKQSAHDVRFFLKHVLLILLTRLYFI